MDKWIKELKKGDLDSANYFVRHHYDQIYRYVYKLTNNKDNSMDLTQEIFIKAINHIDQFKKGNIKNWLYTISHHHVMSYFKTKTYKSLKREVEISQILEDNFILDETLLKNETYHYLSKAISSLKEPLKDVIVLKYFEELTIAEIAKELKINDNTVKTRLRRGISKLKEILERDGYFE